MTLAIDIGNSSTKAALFDGDRLVEVINNYELIINSCEKAIYVSTSGQEIPGAMRFDHTTPVPLKNLYATPETLGGDRLAAAVGAAAMFPGENLLVVDFGTAATFDVVADGAFLGGNISPGAAMRFRALNEFTGRLPLVAVESGKLTRRQAEGNRACSNCRGAKERHEVKVESFPATNTIDAIYSGVVGGMVAEVEKYFERAAQEFGVRRAIFAGGDAPYFAERVKIPIFVASELVLRGLNAILNYNAK